MKSYASSLAILAAAGVSLSMLNQSCAAASLSIPSSPEIAATAPAASTQAGRGVIANLDSNPWIPVAAILGTIAAGPFLRRYLAR